MYGGGGEGDSRCKEAMVMEMMVIEICRCKEVVVMDQVLGGGSDGDGHGGEL